MDLSAAATARPAVDTAGWQWTLLAAWETATPQHPVRRALTLLAAAWPELPPAMFSRLSIGQRDAYLLTLREQLFGPRLTGVAHCAQCAERLELTFEVADIRAPLPATDQDSLRSQPPELTVGGYRVRYRLPDSADLLAILETADAESQPARGGETERLKSLLLQRCVLSVERDDQDATEPAAWESGQLPASVADALVAHMELADPQGNVQLALDCPACGHHWSQAFDILAYLWREIDDWALRTLAEVHLLASAYGWTEREILALSAHRRQSYLEMVLA